MPGASMLPTTDRPLGSDAYRRQARRLRARLAANPVRLHRSLASLSAGNETQSPRAQGQATRFAQLVARSFDGPVLRFSQRQRLLRQARSFGIDRFEANLVIAALQHRARRERSNELAPRPGPQPWVESALLFVVIQGLVAALLYRFLLA